MSPSCRWCVTVAVVLWAGAPALAQPTILFDYTYDTNGFFGTANSAQRLALETAGSRITARLGDTLTAITPGGSNTWEARTFNPATGNNDLVISNLTIAQNEVRVFVGGFAIGGGTLAFAGPGGFAVSGTQEFVDTVVARGQSGALGAASAQTDFARWGGAMTFDTGRNWNFSVPSGPTLGQFDFLSVAEHELGHVFGIGTANSWLNRITGTTFTGPAATALNGGVNPTVEGDGGHWAEGTTYNGQPVLMDPSIAMGQRIEFTEFDFAGLSDLGWQIQPVPEPATVLAASALGLAGAGALRRRRAAGAGLAA